MWIGNATCHILYRIYSSLYLFCPRIEFPLTGLSSWTRRTLAEGTQRRHAFPQIIGGAGIAIIAVPCGKATHYTGNKTKLFGGRGAIYSLSFKVLNSIMHKLQMIYFIVGVYRLMG